MPRTFSGNIVGGSARAGTRKNLQNMADPDEVALTLYPWSVPGVYSEKFDFGEKAFDTTNVWSVGGAGTSTPFAINSPQTASGSIKGVSGTTASNGCAFAYQKVLKGANNCGAELRMQVDVITNVQIEFGIIDASSGISAVHVSGVDTPTFTNGVGDGAVLVLKTNEAVNNKFALATLSSNLASTQAAQLGQVVVGGPSTFVPTAATDFVMRVQLTGANPYGTAITNATAQAWIFDNNMTLQVYRQLTLAVTSSVLLMPYLNVSYLSTAAKTPIVDYLRFWQDRV